MLYEVSSVGKIQKSDHALGTLYEIRNIGEMRLYTVYGVTVN